MSPFALYLIMNQEIVNLRNESPRRFIEPEVRGHDRPSVLQRIRAAVASIGAGDAASTPTLLDYPYRS